MWGVWAIRALLRFPDKVKAYIVDSKQDTLPIGMEMSFWDDDSERLRDRLGIMTSSAVQGSILVILLLSLFLRPAVGIWVFLGIPISFLGAFIVLSFARYQPEPDERIRLHHRAWHCR